MQAYLHKILHSPIAGYPIAESPGLVGYFEHALCNKNTCLPRIQSVNRARQILGSMNFEVIGYAASSRLCILIALFRQTSWKPTMIFADFPFCSSFL